MHPSPIEKNDQDINIFINIVGKAGVITLTRPKSLNALNVSMIRTLTNTLHQWQNNPEVAFVIIQSTDSKAFCAGGDIRAVYAARLQDDFDFCETIFREEYQLNYLISSYSKPYIALIDGICMGGGMGISIHGSHRIVTENAVMAMPESGIGFFPDIGASYFLNQCPGEIGTFLGIVGEKIKAGDAVYANLATHYISSSNLHQFSQKLLQAKSAADAVEIIEKETESAPSSDLKPCQDLINHCFKGRTIESIIQKLETANNSCASDWLRALDKHSPTSLRVSLELLRRNQRKSLKECLSLEFRLSQRFSRQYDFFEGVRALLIDKDNVPHWLPRHLNQVTPDMVKAYFAPLENQLELKLD